MRPLVAMLVLGSPLLAADDVKKRLAEAADKLTADLDPAAGKAERAKAFAQAGDLYLKAREPAKAADAFTKALAADPERAGVRDRRGDAYLWLGKFADAVADYDAYLDADPKFAPKHWRRGIALYYAGKHEEGVKQFALHKMDNPEDVENAAWHYLCNVKVAGKEKAQKELIDVTRDPRIPMAEIQKLFAGKMEPKDVLAAAGKATGAEKDSALFYAHLYVGLWYDAEGDAAKVKEHLTTAVEKHPVPDYMWDVGNAHLQTLKAK